MPAAGEEIPDLDVAPAVQHREEGDDKYRIMMAVAGFGENDIEITAQENLLVVSGNLGKAREAGTTYLYRGIATCAFERPLQPCQSRQGRRCDAGRRRPAGRPRVRAAEAMKPRRIVVESKPGSSAKVIERKKVIEGKRPPDHL